MPKKGQRAKMSKRTEVDIVDKKVIIRLSCGHSYENKPAPWSTPEESQKFQSQFIGSRERCDQCTALL